MLRKAKYTGIILWLALASALAQNSTDVSVRLKKANDALRKGQPTEAEKIALSIIASPDLKKKIITQALAERLLATVCASQSRKSEEIDHLFKSNALFKQGNIHREEAEAQRLIGQYYIHLKLYNEATNYLNNAFRIALALRDSVEQVKIISNQAQVAYSLTHYDQALKLFQEAILLSSKIKFKQGLFENWERISYVYWQTSEPLKMLQSMKNAMRFLPTNADTLGIFYGDLGQAYLENRMIDSAELNFRRGLTLINQGSNTLQEMLLYNNLYRLSIKQNSEKVALRYLEKYTALREKIYSKALTDESYYAESKYKLLQNSVQLKATEERGQRLLIALVAALIISVALAFFLLRLRHLNRKTIGQGEKLSLTNSQLARSENLYRNLFENNVANITTHTLDGTIIDINHSGTQTFGLSKEKIIGRSVKDFIHPDYQAGFADYLDEVKEKGESKGWMRVIDGNGKERILRYENKLLQLDGEIPFVIGFAQDQSDLFTARMAAERQRKQLELIMDNSPDILAVLNKEATVKYINRSNAFDDREVIGKSMFYFLPNDQATVFYKTLKEVFELNSILQWEQSVDGKHYLTKLVPIANAGKVNEVLAIITDITQIKNVESELKKLSSIIQQSNVGVLITNAEGIATWANDGFTNNTGLEKLEIIGRNPSSVLQSPSSEKPKLEFVNAQVASRIPFTIDLKHTHKSGAEYWVNLIAQPVVDDQDVFQGYFYIQHNVTHEREMMAQVVAAKEEAENSNRLKTIFLGNLSHEVRTPLQGILGFAEVLENPQLPEAQKREYLNIIKRRTTDMQNIIESLLDLASYETGEIKAFPVPVNLYEAIDTTFLKAKQDAEWTSGPIEMILENSLMPNEMVMIDPQHLYQVLINLLRNALKFTNAGTITLRAEPRSGLYQISVIDTGIGIAPEKVEQIFKPFRQAHEGLSRAKGGIGLGLSICTIMVELWGSEIKVSSGIGKGSTFSFTIPKK